MSKCEICDIEVLCGDKCPICKNEIKNNKQNMYSYPNYKENYMSLNRFKLSKLLLFIVIAGIIVTATVNFFTLKSLNYWSMIVASALIYNYITYKYTIVSRKSIGSKVLVQFFLLSALIIIIDYTFKLGNWSIEYVVPGLSIIMTILLTSFAFTYKSGWQDYMGYLISAFFISLLPLALFIFKISSILWTSAAAFIYSLLTVIGLLIFSPSEFKDEIKKRFHF